MMNASSGMKVLLVAGGWSPEREISLRGAESVREALTERGHDVTLFDLSDGFEALLDAAKGKDVAFLNLHGCPGEDGLVQALLEQADLPYQGAGPSGSFLALNKAAAKALFRQAGLLTPDWIFLPTRPDPDWRPHLPYPLFVKSNTGGSSLQLYHVTDDEELKAALDELFEQRQEVIIESQIQGQELTCGILEAERGRMEPLPPVLIVPKHDFFDYHDKYAADGAEEICPAPLPRPMLERVQTAAIKAHACLGLSGYSRVDFMLTEQGELYVLEANTLPGMTQASLLPKEAAAAGLSFGELLERLLNVARATRS